MVKGRVYIDEETKKRFFAGVIIAVVVWLIIFSSVMFAIKASPSSKIEIIQPETKDKIDVSGTARLSEKADLVEITLGLENQASTASTAQRENTNLMDRIYKAVFSYVQKEAVETLTYELYPVRNLKSPRQEIVGYKVKHLIKIKTSPSLAGNIVDAAVNSGANQINSIVFTLSETKKEKLGNSAIKAAIEDATKKASMVAAELGLKLKEPIYVNAEYVSVKPVYKRYAEIAGTEIATGDVEVLASVSVSYSFE
jgi:hypothetical protein